MTSQPSRPGKHFKETAEAPDSGHVPESGFDETSMREGDVAPEGEDTPSDEAGAPVADEDRELPPLPDLPEDPHAGMIKKRKRTHRRAKRRAKIALIVLAVLVVLLGGAAAVLAWLLNSGAESVHAASTPGELATADTAVSADKGMTVEYNGTTYRYNENMVSIVVIGYDRRENQAASEKAGQADAVMVVAMDTKTGKVTMIGIPRDTMVDVDESLGDAFIGQDRLQLALAFAYGDGYESSSENVVRAVSRILYNMPMTYYFSLDMQGVGPINDAMGGVTLTPIESIPDTSIVEGNTMTLHGNNALRYVQWRDWTNANNPTSSLDRQQRQVQYLKAFFQQAVSYAKGNPLTLAGLFSTGSEYATTNLTVGEVGYMAAQFLRSGSPEFEVTTLQGQANASGRYLEYELDEQSVYETVLSVYYTPVEDAPADAASAE